MKFFHHFIVIIQKSNKTNNKTSPISRAFSCKILPTISRNFLKNQKNKGIVWNQVLEEIEKKDTNCNKSINPSYVLTISTQIRLDGHHHRIKFEKFDAYAKYNDANFSHSLNALNAMFFYVVTQKEIVLTYFIIPN